MVMMATVVTAKRWRVKMVCDSHFLPGLADGVALDSSWVVDMNQLSRLHVSLAALSQEERNGSHIFRRYWPPTSKRVEVIWPSEQTLTASISTSNTLLL